MRLLATALILGTLVFGVADSAAAKSLDVTFARTTARTGDTVTARGSFRVWPALAAQLPSIVVYLIPTRLGHADYNTGVSVLPPPGSRRTYRLGAMSVRDRRLYLRFAMPEVPPGDYMTATWCPESACNTAAGFRAGGLWGARWTKTPGDVIRVVP